MLALVFAAGRVASTQMSDVFVVMQHILDFRKEAGIDCLQPLCDILVDCALTNAELICRRAHSGFSAGDVPCYVQHPLIDVVIHTGRLPQNGVVSCSAPGVRAGLTA